MGTTTFALLVVRTQQVEAMRDFYAGLGIEFIEEQHGNGPVHFAGRIGDAIFEIYPLSVDGAPADTTTRLGFRVDNLPSVIAAMRSAGASIVAEPMRTEWGLRAVVRDPDGRAVELYAS